MTINPLPIGLKVRALRQTQNMTQEKLAGITGVSWRTISNLERGLALPTLKLIYELSQYFNVSIDELLNYRIDTSKTISRQRLEQKVTESIKTLDDNTLFHIKEYIVLCKKTLPQKNTL